MEKSTGLRKCLKLCVLWDGRDYLHSDQEVMQKYGGQMAMCMRMSEK